MEISPYSPSYAGTTLCSSFVLFAAYLAYFRCMSQLNLRGRDTTFFGPFCPFLPSFVLSLAFRASHLCAVSFLPAAVATWQAAVFLTVCVFGGHYCISKRVRDRPVSDVSVQRRLENLRSSKTTVLSYLQPSAVFKSVLLSSQLYWFAPCWLEYLSWAQKYSDLEPS